MGKAFSIIALIVAICMLLIFGLDAAIGIPFRKASVTMDGGFIFCGVVLSYLSWRTFREQR
jgi:membrane protein implicated in regulation of membrane protease activity